jgi:hypothetical protein
MMVTRLDEINASANGLTDPDAPAAIPKPEGQEASPFN